MNLTTELIGFVNAYGSISVHETKAKVAVARVLCMKHISLLLQHKTIAKFLFNVPCKTNANLVLEFIHHHYYYYNTKLSPNFYLPCLSPVLLSLLLHHKTIAKFLFEAPCVYRCVSTTTATTATTTTTTTITTTTTNIRTELEP